MFVELTRKLEIQRRLFSNCKIKCWLINTKTIFLIFLLGTIKLSNYCTDPCVNGIDVSNLCFHMHCDANNFDSPCIFELLVFRHLPYYGMYSGSPHKFFIRLGMRLICME